LATEKFNGVALFSQTSSQTGSKFTVPTSEDGSQNTTVTQAALAKDPMMDMMINGFKSFEINGKKYISLSSASFSPTVTALGSQSMVAYEVPGGVGSPVTLVNTITGAAPYMHTISVTRPSGSAATANNSNLAVTSSSLSYNFSTTLGGKTNSALNYTNSDEYAFLSQEALQQVADMRAQNGAEMSRINFAQDLLNINAVNLEAANSRIMDVDVASESSQLARFQILQQAGTAMLAQANTSQQNLVRLLQG
jgi:flagellin